MYGCLRTVFFKFYKFALFIFPDYIIQFSLHRKMKVVGIIPIRFIFQ